MNNINYIQKKYGICDTYLPYDYDPNSNTLPTWGEYVVQRNEFGKPMYYIAFNILENGNIYRPILVCTPEQKDLSKNVDFLTIYKKVFSATPSGVVVFIALTEIPNSVILMIVSAG